MRNEGKAISPKQIKALNRSFDFLYSGLREAKRRFDAGDDFGRDGAIHALELVIKFLSLFQPVRAEFLHAPLARLFTDLMALNDGTCSAMLTPSSRSGRAPANSAYDAMKGMVVFTIRRLEATGMRLPEARKLVAAKLTKLKMRPARSGSKISSGQVNERTLRGWQQQIAADVGCLTTAAQTLKEAEREHHNEVLTGMQLSTVPEGSTPDTLLLSRFPIAEIRRAYIDRLASYVERTRSAETT
jgi:hypothetical protein